MKCAGDAYDKFGFHSCRNTGKLEHDGKWWCKLHHPPTSKAKAEAQEAKWRLESEARRSQWAVADRNRRLAEKALEYLRKHKPEMVHIWERGMG